MKVKREQKRERNYHTMRLNPLAHTHTQERTHTLDTSKWLYANSISIELWTNLILVWACFLVRTIDFTHFKFSPCTSRYISSFFSSSHLISTLCNCYISNCMQFNEHFWHAIGIPANHRMHTTNRNDSEHFAHIAHWIAANRHK